MVGRPLIDLSGQTFGRLSVIGRADFYPAGSGGAKWLCRCECRTEKVVHGNALRSGNTQSCGCLRQPMDLTGQRFSRLVAVSPLAGRQHYWNCACDCGGSTAVKAGNLTSGNAKSCGCFKLDFNKAKAKDITGQRFGALTALRQIPKDLGGRFSWECVCDCGRHKELVLSDLMGGRVISCGCMANKRVAMRPISVRIRQNAHTHRRRAAARAGGGSFTAEEIEALFIRQGGKCAYCPATITRETMHRDHRTPLAKIGSSNIRNIDLTCPGCNLRKGALDAIEFAAVIGRLL